MVGRLVRIGSDYDGGYICCYEDVKNSEIVISGGVNNNWDFELHIQKYKKIPVFAYDASVGLSYYVKQLLELIPKVHRWNLMPRRIKNFLYYCFKYPKSIKIYRNFLGIKTHDNFIDFSEILKQHIDKKIFLKLDIEGWEYRLLPAIKEYSSLFNCVLIEFHDADLHMNEIKTFVRELNLSVVATSVNSYSSIGLYDYPTTIEVTLSGNSDFSETNSYKTLLRPSHKLHKIWDVDYV